MSLSWFRVILFGFCAAAVSAECSSNRTCLDIRLVDVYGDGWNGEKFFLETPWDEMFAESPSCGKNVVSHSFCTDITGNYPMMLIHENESYTPENYWEDLFTVSVSKCNNTITSFTGGYNTTLIFHYNADLDEWSVLYWENLWENQKACDACGDASVCKPKPKSNKSSRKGHSKYSNKPKYSSDDDDDNSYNKTSSETRGGKPKPRYGPPAVNVRVTMFDQEGDGWWQSDYRGASWYLADDRRTSLFQTGSLCGSDLETLKSRPRGRDSNKEKSVGKSGYCNLCLGDGTYSMRFSGEPSPDFTAWDFCGVQGGHAQELTFHIKKGKCIPDSLLSVDAECYGSVVSTVTVIGVVNLMGLTSEFVESSQYSILPGILADSIVGWEAKNIEVLSTTLTSRALSSSSRSLAEFEVDVQFSATFESEADFGVEGRMYSKVVSLVSFLKDSLSSRVSSDGFTLSLAQSAVLAGALSLEKVQSAELVSLTLDSVTYEGVQTMRASTLPFFDVSDYWGSSTLNVSAFDVESVALFAVVVGAGFFAFVGLMSHGMTGYKRVSQLSDSQHHEVLPSDLDSTISGPAVSTKNSLRTETVSSL